MNNGASLSDPTIKEIIARIERLERTVLAEPSLAAAKTITTKNGPAGGVRELITSGFFNQKRSLADTISGLSQNGYHYSVQAVDMALRRMAKRDGPLVAIKRGGKNTYAKRK